LYVVGKLPINLMHPVTMNAWKLWLGLHKHVLPAALARRGMADSISTEAHALHNVLWWTRLFPSPVWILRFGLSQLDVTCPPTNKVRTEWVDSQHTPGLRSAYLHISPASETNPRVLFWVFGGAFVSGSVTYCLGVAERYGRTLGCDVFIVDMRICPEYTVQDHTYDLYCGYEQLLQRGVPPQNIVMHGTSSGGGSILRMLQLAGGDDATRQEFFGERSALLPSLPQPAGAIMLGPFVKLEEPDCNDSMQKNLTYDLIVTRSVYETALDLIDVFCGGRDKLEICSSLYHPMKGVCPLFISVSEHECLIDQDTELAKKAKDEGVDVVLSTRPYMPHVYHIFAGLMPEADQEEAKICDWVKSRGGVWA